MPLRYKRRILDHLKHETYEPAPVDRLAADLGVEGDQLGPFRAAVEELAEQGTVALDPQGRVGLPRMGGEVVGVFRKNARGFGFVIPDVAYREGDVFVPPEETADALTGDRVRVELERRMRRGKPDLIGRVVEVLSRKRSNFTGEIKKRGGQWIVFPDGRELTAPIVARDADAKNAKEGDKVVIEIVTYPEGSVLAEGVVVKVLGEAGLPSVETEAVVAAYSLPGEFPEACKRQAREVTREFDEQVAKIEAEGTDERERIDLREQFTLTIDPPDAKDYDDALSIKRTEDGGWELGVHIADVTTFVTRGSPMDAEGRERGNSVYLPRLVIPMLPELLSNGICSLAEGVVRFCKSAFIRYDREGRVSAQGVGSTVIRSNKRLTYLEAQALINGDIAEARKHAKTEPKYTDELIAALREMDACSRVIRERRRKAGMIHLELPEAELVFDELGHVVDVVPEDDAYTHTLIEMFMVEANEVLARLFEGVAVPLIRRVHPEPTPGDIGELQQTARVAGYTIPKSPTRFELQALLDATAGTGAARAVHMAVLRTLTKAEYSPALIGHFALASEAYAHFTSPIRRYADVTVHRALGAYLDLTGNGTKRPEGEDAKRRLGRRLLDSGAVPDQDELVEIARHCTAMEVNAEDAERNLRQFLVLQYLEEHVGDVFDGVCTGVSPAGVFVQLEKFLAEGMIKTTDLAALGAGFWRIDPRTGALANERTGRSFKVGDKFPVQIASIDLAMRRMDLVLGDPKSRAAAGKAVKPAKGGLGGGGLNIDLDRLKHGTSGAERRSRRSKSREKGKTDHRGDRKDKGKRQ